MISSGSWQRAGVAVALVMGAAAVLHLPSVESRSSAAALTTPVNNFLESPLTGRLVALTGTDMAARVAAIALLLATVGFAGAFAPRGRGPLAALFCALAGASVAGTWVLPLMSTTTGGVIALAFLVATCAWMRVSLERPTMAGVGYLCAFLAPAFHPLGFLSGVLVAVILGATPGATLESIVRRTAPLLLYGFAAPLVLFSTSTVSLVAAVRQGAPLDGPAQVWTRLFWARSAPEFVASTWIPVGLLIGTILVFAVWAGRRNMRSAQAAVGALFVLWSPLVWMWVPSPPTSWETARSGSWMMFTPLLAGVAALLEWGLSQLDEAPTLRLRGVALILVGVSGVAAIRFVPPPPHVERLDVDEVIAALRREIGTSVDARVIMSSELHHRLPANFPQLVSDGFKSTTSTLRLAPLAAPKQPAPTILVMESRPSVRITAPFRDGIVLPHTASLQDADVASAWMQGSSTPPTPGTEQPWSGQFRAWNGEESLLSPAFELGHGETLKVFLGFARGNEPQRVGRVQLESTDGSIVATMPLTLVATQATASVMSTSLGRFRLRVFPVAWPGPYAMSSITLDMTKRGS